MLTAAFSSFGFAFFKKLISAGQGASRQFSTIVFSPPFSPLVSAPAISVPAISAPATLVPTSVPVLVPTSLPATLVPALKESSMPSSNLSTLPTKNTNSCLAGPASLTLYTREHDWISFPLVGVSKPSLGVFLYKKEKEILKNSLYSYFVLYVF